MQQPRAPWAGGGFFLHHSSAPSEILKEHKASAHLMDSQVGKKSYGGFSGGLQNTNHRLNRQQAGPARPGADVQTRAGLCLASLQVLPSYERFGAMSKC